MEQPSLDLAQLHRVDQEIGARSRHREESWGGTVCGVGWGVSPRSSVRGNL